MRSPTGYMAAMGVEPYQDSDLLCRSSMRELTSRQAKIDSSLGPPLNTALNVQDINVSEIEYEGLDYYLSISQCIISVLGLSGLTKGCAKFKQCPHDDSCKRPCVDIYSNKGGVLCLECGLDGPCDITVDMSHHTIALFDEQCRSPRHFMDSQGYLPKCIANQWKQFLMKISPESQNTKCIHMSRGCIKIGQVKYRHYSFIAWMARPTVAYSQWKYTSHIMDAQTMCYHIRTMYRSWRPFNDKELRISLCKDDCNSVHVSGDMAAIYIDNVRIPDCNIRTTCTSLGLAGSTVRFQVIDHSAPVPVPVDIACNIELLRSTLPEDITHREVIVKNSITHIRVQARMVTNNRPSITFGKNGGVQYRGKVEHVAKTYYTVLKFVSSNMNSTGFISSMVESNTMANYIYPSGIPRTGQKAHK
eukprot:scaffold25642_cov73-Attheya_sp.AAC.2